MRKSYIINIFLSLLMVSCSEIEETLMDVGLDYQPLSVGNYWEYEVTEIVYFGESDVEESTFFYRDQITSDYFNEEGEQVFLYERKRSADRNSWLPMETFAHKINKGALVRNIGNRHTVPLIFPPVDGKEWNGNVYNADQEENYHLQVLQHYTLGEMNYNDVIKVVQQEEDDRIILRDYRYEVFAKGIGLVESYYEVLNYCSRNDCLGQQIIESGRFVHFKLIQHG